MRLLKIEEVAKLLSIPKARAYQLARDSLIPVVRIGRQIRVSEEALAAWVEHGGQALPGGWRRTPDAEEAEPRERLQDGVPRYDRSMSSMDG